MFPLMSETPLNAAQVAAVTAQMLHIAHVDGARTQEEVALIRQFYEGSRAEVGNLPAFEALHAAPLGDPGLFADAGLREMLLALCLMVAYADGEFSAAERAAVAETATSLGVAPARLEEILAQVKDALLAQLSRLPDAESVAVVARELG